MAQKTNKLTNEEVVDFFNSYNNKATLQGEAIIISSKTTGEKIRKIPLWKARNFLKSKKA